MNPDGHALQSSDLKPTLAPHFYSSADVFALETKHIFHDQWFCVGRAGQVAEKGDCLHVEVAGESVLLVRGRDDELRAFYNVCRHRGSQLVREKPLPDAAKPAARNTGRAGAAIVCPYHAWSYNLDGTLRAAPFVQFDSICPKDRFSLLPVALETWGGFIFLNLSTMPSPLAAQFEKVTRMLGRYPFAEMRRGAQIVYDVRANWKVIMENYNECYHCGPVHPELCALVPAFREQGGAGLAWEDGIPHRPGAWTFTASGTSTRAPFPGLSEAERTRHKGEIVYPNLLLSAAAEHVAAFMIWPKEPERTLVACEFLFHESEVKKPGFDPGDVVDFWDVVNRQDWRVCEGVQAGMHSRGFQGGFYAPMEDPSMDIRRYLQRHLGDLSAIPGN
ncbi:MAG TPA: aromatic ring-hydroxylating dioxygenase subunit alpha [Steroidobacteraceae bacterium]